MPIEDYYVFLDALKMIPMLSMSDPAVLALFNDMKKQRDQIWDLGEVVDRVRPSMRDMFPEDPPEYGVTSYSAQTGEQYPINGQLLQELDIITDTF